MCFSGFFVTASGWYFRRPFSRSEKRRRITGRAGRSKTANCLRQANPWSKPGVCVGSVTEAACREDARPQGARCTAEGGEACSPRSPPVRVSGGEAVGRCSRPDGAAGSVTKKRQAGSVSLPALQCHTRAGGLLVRMLSIRPAFRGSKVPSEAPGGYGALVTAWRAWKGCGRCVRARVCRAVSWRCRMWCLFRLSEVCEGGAFRTPLGVLLRLRPRRRRCCRGARGRRGRAGGRAWFRPRRRRSGCTRGHRCAGSP